MKFSCIFVITFWCNLYISEKSTAMRVENFVIQPADEGSNVIIEESSETDTSDMVKKDNNPISGNEHFVMQPDDDGSNDIIEKNSVTDTADMQRTDKKTISGDENFVIQPADEGFNVISENSPETVSSGMQRKGKNTEFTFNFKSMFNNTKPKSIRNCLDLKKEGKGSGTYLITPCDDTNKVVNVYCDMVTDGGGWTVIQRRDNYPNQENFQNPWYKYAVGFGDPSRDFWLGNDNIHCLTDQINNEIRFDLEDWSGSTRYASYSFFYIDDRTNKYKLVIQNYTGTAGNSLGYHNNMFFSTFDNDNDRASSNCAVSYTGAWWYGACHHSNLNGLYNVTAFGKGNNWYHWKGHYYALKKSEMKIRPKNE